MSARYNLRANKRSKPYGEEQHDSDDEDQKPAAKRVHRASGSRRRSSVTNSQVFVHGDDQRASGTTSEQGASGGSKAESVGQNVDGNLNAKGQIGSDDLVIDTPPSSVSVHEDNSIGGTEQRIEDNLLNTPDKNPIYYEENTLLYNLYRERLARSGAPDLYRGYNGGYQASVKPWH